MLAMNLDDLAANLLQQRGRNRLVIDEGARGTCRRDHALQGQRFIGRAVNAAFSEQRPGRMVGPQGEFSQDRRLICPLAHQLLRSGRAERDAESVKNDGFAGTGFPGEGGEAIGSLDIEPFDEQEGSDGERCDHAPLLSPEQNENKRFWSATYQGVSLCRRVRPEPVRASPDPPSSTRA